MSIMDESAVLAEKFVPNQLKDINTASPNHLLETFPIPTLDTQIMDIQQSLRPLPNCCCSPPNKHNLAYPIVQLAPEISFALLPQEATKFNGTIKPVDEVANLRDYLETFHTLLQLERHEVLRQYERYSQ
jgi:hypothetical protein